MKRFLLNILLFSFLLSFLGCADETLLNEGTAGVNKDKSARLTLNLTLPNTRSSKLITKAVDDKSIENLYILGFRVDEEDETIEYFDYLTSVSSSIENIGSNQRTIKATVNQADYKQRFVVIANSAEVIAALNPRGQRKEDVLNALIFQNSENEWNSTLPMWGESVPQIIKNQETSLQVTLTRMVASIDITIAESLRSTFALKEVYLYNAKTRGRIVPDNINWDPSAKKVTGPTLPPDNDPENNPLTKDTPFQYEVNDPDGGALMGAIYTFEAKAETEDRLQATSLVIGGEYNGKMSYYRLDLTGQDENDNTYELDILRNHKYTVQITTVAGEGRPNPEEAFKAVPVELSATIKEWNLAEVGVVIDEQYFLKVSDGLFEVSGDYTILNLHAETDHPAGLVLRTNDPWITLDGGNEGDQERDLALTIEANNNAFPRNGMLEVIAGNLTYVVHIVQGIDTWITITKQPFYVMNGETHSLMVHSNASWTVKVKDNEGWDENYLVLSTLSKPDPDDESTVSFVTYNDLERMIKTEDFTPHDPVEVTLVFEDENSASMKEVTVSLVSIDIAKPSNSYLLQSVPEGVKPSTSHGIYIPLSMIDDATRQHATMGDKIRPTETLDPELIWTDNQYVLGEDAAISEIKLIVSKNNKGFLYVQPGHGEGNALIGIFPYIPGFDYYKWSWHIWVSEEKDEIEKNVWMDRNLGALTNSWSSATEPIDRVTGLYYQWGRKEPFTLFTKWIETKQEYKSTYPDLHALTTQGAVRYPFDAASNPWTGMLESPDSWMPDGTEKNVFDPCPVGWRLPTKDELSGYAATFNSGITGEAGYLPAGGRFIIENGVGTWEELRKMGYYWVSDGDQLGTAYNFTFDETNQTMTTSDARYMSNVRCIRDY